jgi:5'-3' exonuclease
LTETSGIIRYQCSSVSERKYYYCHASPRFKYKKEIVKFCEENELPVEDIQSDIDPEPVEYCLHSVKQMIHSIMDKVGAESARVFLTGKGNYREQIDSRYPYKGNRPSYKPTHFEAVGEYLIKNFNAEVVDGMEADDAMSIAQYEASSIKFGNVLGTLVKEDHKTIICTLDKDLNMAYGWHYNWQKDEKYWVEPDEADEFFYMQLLAGDQQVDNIHGIKGIGLKTAKKILADCPDNKSRYERCLEKYTEAGMTYWDLLENSALLWIQREKDKLWQPPTQ